jgi:triacylglycerol lipase
VLYSAGNAAALRQGGGMWRTLNAVIAALVLWPTFALSTETPASRQYWPRPVYRFDPNLAVEYGNLIDLVYEMNDAAVYPHEYTPPYNGLPPPDTGLPSSYNFVAWIRMNDFTPRGKIRPKFYGIIVQRKSDPSTFILVLRGTQFDSATEWFDDFTSIVPVTRLNLPGKVGDGFARIFESMEVIGLDGHPTNEFGHGFVHEVFAAISRKLMRRGARMTAKEQATTLNRINIEVTGHSLGSALATLYVAANATDVQLHISRVYTFASPYVGNFRFVKAYNDLGIETWRIANFWDWVPHLPPDPSFWHVNEPELISSWFEVHADPGCWHSMQTYLHILDPMIAIEDKCKPLVEPEQPYIAGH